MPKPTDGPTDGANAPAEETPPIDQEIFCAFCFRRLTGLACLHDMATSSHFCDDACQLAFSSQQQSSGVGEGSGKPAEAAPSQIADQIKAILGDKAITCWAGKRYLYIRFQDDLAEERLTAIRGEEYLAWLRSGKNGTYFDFVYEQIETELDTTLEMAIDKGLIQNG